MLSAIDWTKFDEVTQQCKENPKKVLRRASFNDLRLIAFAASQDVYRELREMLAGNEEAQKLLSTYSHLNFVHYQFEDADPGDLAQAKEEVVDIWPRLATM